MGEVVHLGKPDPLLWVCNCGCSTFRLHSTGATECASCGVFGADNADWFAEMPEPVAAAKKRLPETKVISLNDSPAAAVRTMLSRVVPEETVALIAIMENGRVRTWGGIDTEERALWLDRRLDEARELLTMFVSPKATNG